MPMKAATAARAQSLRKAIFFGVNALIALVVYLLAIEPLRAFLGDRADAIAERRGTLAGYEAIASQEATVKDYARQVEESNARGELLTGESEGVVNANLQARLKALAEEAGATVMSLQALPAKVLNGETLVGARLDVTGPLPALHKLAKSLEGDPPLLLVLTAAVRKTAIWSEQTAAEQTLEAQFDVFGGASKGHS
jgi:general secretion pathway protein M